MDSEFNLNIVTNITKKACITSFIAMFLIVLFIISPLSGFIKTSAIMKIIVIILLGYTIYLNILQINSLKNANLTNKPSDVVAQFNMNTICSYIFTFCLCLLTLFVIKSFF